MERILVTGANGFIGSHLCPFLTDKGYEVIVAVRAGGGPHAGLGQVVHVSDVGPDTDWSEALKDVSAIVHLAGRAHRMNESPEEASRLHEQINTQGTLNLARQARDAGVRRLVFLSTVKVNGETTDETPFSESDEPHPSGPYAESKWRAEQGLNEIAAGSDFEIVIIRPPLVYGPGVRANFLALLKAVDKGIPLPLARIRNKRSMVGVRNLAHLIECCLRRPEAAGNVFLVSDDCDVSTPELIRAMAECLQRRARLILFPMWLLRGAAKLAGKTGQFDRLTESLTVSVAKAREVLDWTPPFSFHDELTATADWYIKNFRCKIRQEK
jgi:nucleoside-diphosphate-sugar epimerase